MAVQFALVASEVAISELITAHFVERIFQSKSTDCNEDVIQGALLDIWAMNV